MGTKIVTVNFNEAAHSAQQRLLFNVLAIPGLLECWIAGGNKVGKSLSLGTAFGSKLPVTRQAVMRWVAPYYSQSRIGFDYIRRGLPEEYIRANESTLTIKMPHNDSRIEFFHGQNPRAQEGAGPVATALDEAAKLREEVYLSAKTTTLMTKGPIIGFSTPLGKNWFFKKCEEAKEEMLRAKHEGRRPTKIFLHMPSTLNPHLSQEVIDDFRKSMTERLFRQQVMAEFIGSGKVFDNLHRCFYTDYTEVKETFRWPLASSDRERLKQMKVTVGVDWARINDFTVFIASEPATRRIVSIWRMKGVPYPEQIKLLIEFTRQFKDVFTVWHDKTGVGVALDDLLGQTALPFHGVTFTNASKNEMMVKLILATEEQSYLVPYLNVLANEFDSLEIKTTPLGLASYAASEGNHDDIVMATALSHLAMQHHSERDFEIIEY